MSLTGNEQIVLRYLKSRGWTSPTQIGFDLKGPGYHSAWASPICKKLVAKGILERNNKGWYRIAPQEGR